MTILEAIKSGKPFRRKIHSCGGASAMLCNCKDWRENRQDSGWTYAIKANDILADDWEVEEKRVEITRGQLHSAFLRQPKLSCADIIELFPLIAKELGL